MEAKLFRMRLITNLHMGSGEVSFNFIDNQVQRDPITGYPNMHPSGIKGALRELFNNIAKEYVIDIFGSENDGEEDNKQGKVSFIEGKLLSIPVRSNKKSYFMGTTIEIIREYLEFSNLFVKFGKNENKEDLGKVLNDIEKKLESKKVCVIGSKIEGLLIESFEINEIDFIDDANKLEGILGIKDIVIIEEENFKDEISRRLPVIARNQLENGKSQNLWYEEVVPRESVFYTGFINSQKVNSFKDFCKKLEENLVQIGANATIGYGFTKFEEVK